MQRPPILVHNSDLLEEVYYFIINWNPTLNPHPVITEHLFLTHFLGAASLWILLQWQGLRESLAVFCWWPIVVLAWSPTHHPRLPGPFRSNGIDASMSDLGQGKLGPHWKPPDWWCSLLKSCPKLTTCDPFPIFLASLYSLLTLIGTFLSTPPLRTTSISSSKDFRPLQKA